MFPIKILVFSLVMATLSIPAWSELREDIEYGRVNQTPLLLDAHIPDGAGPFPAVIIVHGGGWVRGDRKHTVQPLFEPLSHAGYAWFSISYRLASDLRPGKEENGFPSVLSLGAAIDDVRRAVAYVKDNATDFRVDPGRIALIGESAGAQLASMAALKPDPNGKVRAVVAMYSPSDLASLAEKSPQIPDSIRRAIQGSPLANILLSGLNALSPIYWVNAAAPPFLMIHGTADTLVPFEQSEKMCEALTTAGSKCELYPVEGGSHGMRRWEALHLTGYKTKMIEWLDHNLKPKVAAEPVSFKR